MTTFAEQLRLANEVLLETLHHGKIDLEMLAYYYGDITSLNEVGIQLVRVINAEIIGKPVEPMKPILKNNFREQMRPKDLYFPLAFLADDPWNLHRELVCNLNGPFSPLIIVTDNQQLWFETAVNLSGGISSSVRAGQNANFWMYGGAMVADETRAIAQVGDIENWTVEVERRAAGGLESDQIKGVIMIENPETYRRFGFSDPEGSIARMSNLIGQNLGVQLYIKMSPEYFAQLFRPEGNRNQQDPGWLLYNKIPLLFGGINADSVARMSGIVGPEVANQLMLTDREQFLDKRVGMLPHQLAYWNGTGLEKYWVFD